VVARQVPDPVPDPRPLVVSIVESFPDAIALPVAGPHLSLEVRGKRFGWYMEDHHSDGRIVINCKALPGVGEVMTQANGSVYHIPKMAKNRGWGLGIWLDVPGIDWDEVHSLLRDAYQIMASRTKKAKTAE